MFCCGGCVYRFFDVIGEHKLLPFNSSLVMAIVIRQTAPLYFPKCPCSGDGTAPHSVHSTAATIFTDYCRIQPSSPQSSAMSLFTWKITYLLLVILWTDEANFKCPHRSVFVEAVLEGDDGWSFNNFCGEFVTAAGQRLQCYKRLQFPLGILACFFLAVSHNSVKTPTDITRRQAKRFILPDLA